MKKFLGILVIAGALVACNNTAESTTSADSPSTTIVDTLGASSIPPATVDTTVVKVDTTGTATDTSAHK